MKTTLTTIQIAEAKLEMLNMKANHVKAARREMLSIMKSTENEDLKTFAREQVCDLGNLYFSICSDVREQQVIAG